MRWLRIVLSVCLTATMAIGLVQSSAGAVPQEVREKSIAATVKVYALDEDGLPYGWGSGSILTSTGQILTNFHVVADDAKEKLLNPDGNVLVWTTADPREPAVPAYLGKVVRTSKKLDLALITVVADISGTDLAGCLALPTYPLGDSDKVTPGDGVAVIGYPSLGGNTVTYTEGIISGFSAGEGDFPGPWLKTDAEQSGGNSGGAAIDVDGNLIGVPTAGYSDDAGGKVNLLRPINAADEILTDVSGLGVPGCDGAGSLGPVPETGEYGAGGVFFGGFSYPGSEDGWETAPSGTAELSAHFNYAAVQKNTPIKAQWYFNGKPAADATQEDTWPYEAGDGSFSLTLTNAKGLPDGTYTVQVFVGDGTIFTPDVTVGGAEAVDAVSIRGRVLSADSGRPLAGAYFAVLTPGITWESVDFDNREHFLDIAETDANGNFQTTATFPLDQLYSVGVAAEGYGVSTKDDVNLEELDPTGGFADFGDISIKAD